jgi:hypothetical protein
MAFARLALFPGGTEEQFNAIVEALGSGHTDQPDRLLLVAGPVEDGWQIAQVWTRRESLERFVQDQLVEAFTKVGDRGFPAPPHITDFEVYDLQR